MAFFVDTFTDTDATQLTSHTPDTGTSWVKHGSSVGAGIVTITGNQLRGDWNLFQMYYASDAPPSADYTITCAMEVVATSDASNGGGLTGRLDTATTLNCYMFRVRSGTIVLQKFVSGSATTLATVTYTLTTGVHNLELEMNGDNIKCYVQRVSTGNWITSAGGTSASKVACIDVTDSDITAAGRAAIVSRSTAYRFDDFNATEAAGDELTENVSTTMTLTQTLETENILNLDVESTLSLVSTALEAAAREVEDTLSFGQLVTPLLVEDDRQVVESVLDLEQSVTVSGLINLTSSTLALTQEVDFFLLTDQILESVLNLSQSATVVFGVPHSAPWGLANITQTLEFEDGFTNIAEEALESEITFTDEAIASYGFESVLSFTQSVTGGVGQDIEQDLGIIQVVSRGGSIWNRSLSSSMTMTSASNGWNGNDKCFRRVGDASGPSQTGTLTLFSTDGLYSIALRNPETDNRREVAFERVLRETRGGNLIVYRDPLWNVVQTLKFTVVALKRTTLDDLQTFFLNTLGQEIILVDWLGEEWSGVVTRPNEVLTEDRDGYWTLPFEFEGTKLETEGTWQNLNLSQEASATVETP